MFSFIILCYCSFWITQRYVLWIHSWPCVLPYVCNQFFLKSVSYCLVKFCIAVEISKSKSDRNGFSSKILIFQNKFKFFISLKWIKGPKLAQHGVFMSFHKILSLFYVESSLKRRYNTVSVCKPHTWENFTSQVIGQNAFIKADCRNLWSSISLEGMHGYYWIFVRRYSPRIVRIWDYYFRLALPRFLLGSLSAILKVIQNERFLSKQKYFFNNWKHKISNYKTKTCTCPVILQDSLIISISGNK